MSKEGNKRSILSIILKVLKWIVITIISIILLLLLVRGIGKAINNKTPDGGINESMYVDINNSKQWISIYGKDTNNPVILYLHGGPGGATSYLDYKSLRKWSDVYTVVSWDQRDVGLSAKNNEGQKDITYTKELFMTDAQELTNFLLNHLKKDKIALVGHSWGTLFGANLALEHPENYLFYVGTGQVIDMRENEKGLIEAAKVWSKDDKEGQELVAQIDPYKFTRESVAARSSVLERYHFDTQSDKTDYNTLSTIFFNPYYSLSDLYRLYRNMILDEIDLSKYYDFVSSPEFDKFSLLNRTEYQIPYYNINGDHDYQANVFQAQKYFDIVQAPRKKMYTMNDMNHGLIMVRTGEFSDYMHEIAILEQTNNSTTTAVAN